MKMRDHIIKRVVQMQVAEVEPVRKPESPPMPNIAERPARTAWAC